MLEIPWDILNLNPYYTFKSIILKTLHSENNFQQNCSIGNNVNSHDFKIIILILIILKFTNRKSKYNYI